MLAQETCVADLLLRHGCITARQAARLCGVGRFSAVARRFEECYNAVYIRSAALCVRGALPQAELKALCAYLSSVKSKTAYVSLSKLLHVSPHIDRRLALALLHMVGEVAKIGDRPMAVLDVAKVRELCATYSGNYELVRLAKCRTPKRPPPNGKMVLVTFHIPSQWLDALDELARELGVRRSGLIRMAIEDMLRRIHG